MNKAMSESRCARCGRPITDLEPHPATLGVVALALVHLEDGRASMVCGDCLTTAERIDGVEQRLIVLQSRADDVRHWMEVGGDYRPSADDSDG